jgi:hypothetical protein
MNTEIFSTKDMDIESYKNMLKRFNLSEDFRNFEYFFSSLSLEDALNDALELIEDQPYTVYTDCKQFIIVPENKNGRKIIEEKEIVHISKVKNAWRVQIALPDLIIE